MRSPINNDTRKLMDRYQLTAVELAALIGKSERTIHRWLVDENEARDKRRALRAERMIRMMKGEKID